MLHFCTLCAYMLQCSQNKLLFVSSVLSVVDGTIFLLKDSNVGKFS